MCDCSKYVSKPYNHYNNLFYSYTSIEALNTMLNEYQKYTTSVCPWAYTYVEPVLQYALNNNVKDRINNVGQSYTKFLNDNAALINDSIKNNDFESLRALIPTGMKITIRGSNGTILFNSNI